MRLTRAPRVHALLLFAPLVGCAAPAPPAAPTASAAPAPTAAPARSNEEARAVAMLRQRHVDGDRIPSYELDLDRAIRALRDPWTRVYSSSQAAQLVAEISGAAGTGVGLPELLSVDLDAGGRHLEVVAPVPGSPAARAGLRPHDRIVAVSGRPVDTARYADAMAALRARAGQRVVLTIERGGAAREVTLVAGPQPPAVLAAGERRGDVLVIRMAAFTAGSPAAFADLLARERPASLELDLRGHTGGQVDAVRAIASMLAGDIVLAELVGPRGLRTRLPSLPPTGASFDGPIVVRVDGGTASGAELLAAGLRHAGRARVVGHTTFGKCLVHQGEPLPGGRLLLFTAGRLAEPGSRPWCGRGLRPDAAG